jgi:hypothetical protein
MTPLYVDNGQSAHAKQDTVINVLPRIVRSAVDCNVSHALEETSVGQMTII